MYLTYVALLSVFSPLITQYPSSMFNACVCVRALFGFAVAVHLGCYTPARSHVALAEGGSLFTNE